MAREQFVFKFKGVGDNVVTPESTKMKTLGELFIQIEQLVEEVSLANGLDIRDTVPMVLRSIEEGSICVKADVSPALLESLEFIQESRVEDKLNVPVNVARPLNRIKKTLNDHGMRLEARRHDGEVAIFSMEPTDQIKETNSVATPECHTIVVGTCVSLSAEKHKAKIQPTFGESVWVVGLQDKFLRQFAKGLSEGIKARFRITGNAKYNPETYALVSMVAENVEFLGADKPKSLSSILLNMKGGLAYDSAAEAINAIRGEEE